MSVPKSTGYADLRSDNNRDSGGVLLGRVCSLVQILLKVYIYICVYIYCIGLQTSTMPTQYRLSGSKQITDAERWNNERQGSTFCLLYTSSDFLLRERAFARHEPGQTAFEPLTSVLSYVSQRPPSVTVLIAWSTITKMNLIFSYFYVYSGLEHCNTSSSLSQQMDKRATEVSKRISFLLAASPIVFKSREYGCYEFK